MWHVLRCLVCLPTRVPPPALEQCRLLGGALLARGEWRLDRQRDAPQVQGAERLWKLLPVSQLFLQSEPSLQMSRRLMSAPEIAQLKGGSMNSPLTKRRRAKNSPFHREVMPEDRRNGSGEASRGFRLRGFLGPPALLPPTGLGSQPPTIPAGPHRPAHPPSALRLSRRGRSWVAGLLLPALPSQPTLTEAPEKPHCHDALTTTSPPTITSLPPLRKPRRAAIRQ